MFNFNAIATVGFRLTQDEVSEIDEEVFEQLKEDGTLIYIDDGTGFGENFIYVIKAYIAEEGSLISIPGLYHKLNYKVYKDEIDKFKSYFPDSEAQLDVLLACYYN